MPEEFSASVYLYSRFSVNKEGDSNHGSFYLLVDEERYAYKETWVSTDCCPAGSATINLELTVGQIVRVENTGSSLLYGTQPGGFMKSWFTAHLLYALWKISSLKQNCFVF